MKKFWLVLAVAAAMVFVGCGNSSDKKDKGDTGDTDTEAADTGDTDTEAADTGDISDTEPPAEFDPENPGYTVEFDIIDINMMGQPQAMAIGYFMKTAREDLESSGSSSDDEAGLDVCTMGESAPRVPTCQTNDDCAPEQQCVPEYDSDSGQPIENSEHCETPGRASIDVGTVMISGFNGGPYPFMYEPGDQVYKLNGAGDGSIDPAMIAYGVEYEIGADNLTPDDLSSLSAKFTMPPAFQLLEPASQPGGTFGDVVVIDNSKPLTFKWEGNGGKGYIDITITAAESIMNTVSVACRVKDDGEFTVPEEFASQLVFGGASGNEMMDMMLSMMQMIIFDRHTEAPIKGKGISSGFVTTEQLMMVNVSATAPSADPGDTAPVDPEDTGDADTDTDSDIDTDTDAEAPVM